jgi:hypothetical protein
MSDNTGGQAFPNEGFNGWGTPEQGMTLRDYFAAKAMQGMLANPELKDSIFHGVGHGFLEKSAWNMADAMLRARDQA